MPTKVSLSATLLAATAALAQVSAGSPDLLDDQRMFIGPDGQTVLLPTLEEMAQSAARGTDFSAFADYAQRRLELASLVTEIVYVDDDAPVGGDGASWSTAHQSLQDALAHDYSDRLVEIRMAQGTYRPDRFNGANSNDPEATFTPRYEDTDTPTGIFRITGGYAGLGATVPDENDPQQFRTVITGDLLGDDGPDFTNYDDNSLVLFEGFNSELHGMVLEHARQAMVGEGSLTIDGCVVRLNAGSNNRGACTFSGNVLVVKRSMFFRNQSGWSGGAMQVYSSHNALVSNRFLSNSAFEQGGAVRTGINSSALLVMQNNYFAGNSVQGENGSVGGAVGLFMPPITACNTVAFNRSVDGHGGGFGRASWHLVDHYTVYDVYHMNSGQSGRGIHEQFPTLILGRDLILPRHQIRGSFVEDWESSESNRLGSFASTLDTIRDNSGDEVLFVDLAGPDGIIGTPDDDPTPRPDSTNIDRVVDIEGAEVALLDFADLNENGIVDEPLPFDLVGSPRSIDTPGVGEAGGIDAGAIEFVDDPGRFNYTKLMSGRRIDPRSGCSGDHPIRLYVDVSVPYSGDGSSWGEAIRELTDALDIARTHCGPVEVWLAAGIYLPNFSVPVYRASFRTTHNVTILGGFAGWEENADQRDPSANPTILSGDQFGNDDPTDPFSILDNSYRVVLSTGERGGGTLDGVTIAGGHARSQWYAGFASSGDGCLYGNGPYSTGGAVSVTNGELTLIDCTISGCSAFFGTACSASGSGVIRISRLRVLDDQYGIGCLPVRSQVDVSGFDSILAPAAKMYITESVLRPTSTTTPIGSRGFVNGELHLIRSDVDAGVRFLSGSNEYPIGSGRIYARKFFVESSLLHRLSAVWSAESVLVNSVVIARNAGALRFEQILNPPVSQRLSVRNTIVFRAMYAFGDLLPISESISSVYVATNFTNRTDDITVTMAESEDLFIDYRGPDGDSRTPDGDYRLAPGSPAIDSGSNKLVGSDLDILGNDRIINGVVDRGAYETVNFCDGDVTGDGAVDLADLNLILANFGQSGVPGDASGDGVVDTIDLNYVLAVFGKNCGE